MSSGEVFGIECRHHYGVTTHPIVPGEDIAWTVYKLTRGWHPLRDGGYGLTDDNHTWEVQPAARRDWFSRLVIIKNAKSPPFLSLPGLRVPWWVDDGAGAKWFDQEFRLTTREMVAAEVAERDAHAARCLAEAERQRDTIRGRKAAQKALSLAGSFTSTARFIEKRWPQYLGAAA
jgi:hypothetical protein